MKKILVAFLALFLASSAFADSVEYTRLQQLGMPPELAKEVDAAYSSAVKVSEIPKTNNSIDQGTAALRFRNIYAVNINQPTVVITPALTPAATFAPIFAVPTAAANAGGLMPQVTPGNSVFGCNTNGTNAITVWPQANLKTTPTPGTVLGWGTPVAAGTPASLAAGKCIDCKQYDDATSPNTTRCILGS